MTLAEQIGLRLTWSKIPKTDFLVMRLTLCQFCSIERCDNIRSLGDEGAGRCAGCLFVVSRLSFPWCWSKAALDL